ncbi:mutator protein [Hordeum vulgare]|nr:mutator protein [Hordeum vulgare]
MYSLANGYVKSKRGRWEKVWLGRPSLLPPPKEVAVWLPSPSPTLSAAAASASQARPGQPELDAPVLLLHRHPLRPVRVSSSPSCISPRFVHRPFGQPPPASPPAPAAAARGTFTLLLRRTSISARAQGSFLRFGGGASRLVLIEELGVWLIQEQVPGFYQAQGNWEMSKSENMFSLLNLDAEDDGGNDSQMTQTSSTSVQETAARKPGWMVWLLNDVYDVEHQAYFMSEKKMEPEVEDGGKKDRVPTGATFTWIAANFAHCPEDADDEVIQRYARVYMWYVISRTIFADGTGKNAPWMWLKALTVFDNKFSWGSAALAYLYRQTMLVAGRQRTVELVVVCSYFQYGAGNTYLLDALKAHSGIPGMTTATLLDRRRQRKIKDWRKHHKSYVLMFEQSVQATSSIQLTQYRQHCALAFSNYLRWFQESTRVEICLPAYEEDILEEPTEYDELAQGGYSKLIREGYQTSFAPVLNFVRKEVKKQADESEDILDNTPGGKKGRICTSSIHKASSGARMDDGDITSAANTQRNTQEDDVDTPQAADDMTLKAFQRSAYMLKPRKEFKRYSPDDYAKGKNPVAGGSRLSRMRSMDDEVEDDDDDESDDPEQFVVARRKKLASKRGRGPK